MKEFVLGCESKELQDGDFEIGFADTFYSLSSDGVGSSIREQSGGKICGKRTNQGKTSERLNSDDKSEDFLRWIKDADPRCSSAAGIGSSGLKMDVSLDLGLGVGESLSSSSTMTGTGRENCNWGTKNKWPKLLSFPLDWTTGSRNEIHYASPVQEGVVYENMLESRIMRSNSKINLGAPKMDNLDVQLDLPDDLLHIVFSFLDRVGLCQAATVCRRWREVSSHEDFWWCLNFENRAISVGQFEHICERYPNATEVNIYGTPNVYPLAMKTLDSLRNLESLTLGKGRLSEIFFQALSGCRMLKKLTVFDATLENDCQEITINHDRLIELQIVKCRVIRISIRCQQLEILSFRRSSMPIAVLDCPLLREFDIASCHKLSEGAIRSTTTSCPQLESLNVSNCLYVNDETLGQISEACRKLRVLDASYCANISLESVRLPMLTVLKLHSCEGITSASMDALAFSTVLEVLQLDNCGSLTSVSLNLPYLNNIRLVHCRKLVDLNLQSTVLASVTVSNCPSLEKISITSNDLTKLVLQKQESLKTLTLHCPRLQDVDLSECGSLTNSICEVFGSRGGCHVVRSLVLDGCESLTAVSFCSTSLVSLSLGGCREVTSLELSCPYLKHISLDGCDKLERASFSPVGLRTLNLGICPKLNVLNIEAPSMVSLELKGCGILSEAVISCPVLTSLDASFCSQIKDDILSRTASNCPLVESLVLMSCLSIGPDGLSSLLCLPNLTYLDLSYTYLVDLLPVFRSCLNLEVLKLQACKNLSDTSFEPLYKDGALPTLRELDLSSVTLTQSSVEELLAGCMCLTHINLNGCLNLLELDWGSVSFSHPSKSILPKDQPSSPLRNLSCVGCSNIKKVVIPLTTRYFHLSSLNLTLSSNLKEVDASCFNLESLNLSNCHSLHILKLNCPRLITLSLQSCNLDEEVVEAAITQCYMLEILDVRLCSKISPSCMVTFRKACPSLKRILAA